MNIQREDCWSLSNAYEKHYCKKVTFKNCMEHKLAPDGKNYVTMDGEPFFKIEYGPLPVSDLPPALQKNEPEIRAFYRAFLNYRVYHTVVYPKVGWTSAYYYIAKEIKEAYETVVNSFDPDLLKRLTS